MTTMVRSRFDRELVKLNARVLDMGSRARRSVTLATRALMEGNADLAAEVITGDDAINELRISIEKLCYELLAKEQPVAGDMRAIVAATTIVNDLERIGDHGKKIAALSRRLREDSRHIPMGDVGRMSELSLIMLDRALMAYSQRDVIEARAVCDADDQVDALYKQFFNVTLSRMLEDPRLIGAGTYLIQVGHELERVGDRATNVAERVIYAVSGELIDLNV